MKKISLLIFILFLRFNVAAQINILDSLIQELSLVEKSKGTGSAEDTNAIKLLIEIAYQYHKTDPDAGIRYGEQALSKANKIHWNSGIASASNRIGLCYWAKSEYPKALEFNLTALALAEEIDNRALIATIYGNLGLVYNDQQNFSKALESHFKALQMNEALRDTNKIALNLGNIGIVYDAQGKYSLALEYYFKSLKLYTAKDDKGGIARNLGNIGFVYQELHSPVQALDYYFKALEMNRQLGNKILIALNMGNIGEQYFHMASDRPNALSKKLPDSLQKPVAVLKARLYLTSSINLFKEVGDHNSLSELYLYLSNLETFTGNYKASLEAYINYAASQDSVNNEENTKKTIRTQMQYEFNRKQAALKAEQDKKDALSKEELKNQGIMRNFTFIGLAGLFLFTTVVIRQRNKVRKEKTNVEMEKARSEKLLLNILPEETAEELKATGTTQAKEFSEVTVLFTDFKNFTTISEKLSAQELVNEINYCYSAFDNIITKHGIEKIKTIGDSYMCAGGLPVANKTNAEDTVRAAIEIRDFMLNEKQKREAKGQTYFEIRIGCNTGPVVAGIVGIKKFAYDIWGDTVNIASRMESSGEPGKVNISGSTFELVKTKFKCEPRGKIEAKNKGMIDMYFVDTIIS